MTIREAEKEATSIAIRLESVKMFDPAVDEARFANGSHAAPWVVATPKVDETLTATSVTDSAGRKVLAIKDSAITVGTIANNT